MLCWLLVKGHPLAQPKGRFTTARGQTGWGKLLTVRCSGVPKSSPTSPGRPATELNYIDGMIGHKLGHKLTPYKQNKFHF